MTSGRHGGRVFRLARSPGRAAFLFVLIAVSGCGTPPPPLSIPPPKPAARSEPRIVLEPAVGPDPSIVGLTWGGSLAPNRLAVLRGDGRFAFHRVDRPGEPPSLGEMEPDRPATGIVILAPDRIVTGDRAGIALWDTTSPSARRLSRRNLGSVSALAVDDRIAGDAALFVGLVDGRLLRIHARDIDRPDRPVVEVTPATGSALKSISIPNPSREIFLRDASGELSSVRLDRAGARRRIGGAEAVALSGENLAWLGDGPSVKLLNTSKSQNPLRIPLGRAFHSLTMTASGRILLSGEGLVEVVGSASGSTPRDEESRFVTGFRGLVEVATEPGGRSEPRMALGDGSGRVEVVTFASLRDRSEPLPPEEIPDRLFDPDTWLLASRTGGRNPRIREIRDRLARGETVGLPSFLNRIAGEKSLPPADRGEIHALEAALARKTRVSGSTVIDSIDSALSSLARTDRVERRADLLLARGMIAGKTPGSDHTGANESESDGADGNLREAARLYRSSQPPLERSALVCDAVRAWNRLDRGDQVEALDLFRPVAEASRTDPVLRQSAEIERIAASLAFASGDFARASEHDAHAIEKLLNDMSRSGLRRESALSRASALASNGRWREAAETLEPDRAGDPEWRVRRLICRMKAGLSAPEFSSEATEDPMLAGLRAIAVRLGSNPPSPSETLADLSIAAEGFRRTGHEDLGLEFELVRAEALERLGRAQEAALLYAAIARTLKGSEGTGLADHGFRPIRSSRLRTLRGLARTSLTVGRIAEALAAIELFRDEKPSGDRALGLSADDFSIAVRLRRARGRTGNEDETRALRSELATRRRLPPTSDPGAPFDASSLDLEGTDAVLVLAPVGPEGMVGVLLRGDRDPEFARLALPRNEIVRLISRWRAGLGDGGRPIEIGEAHSEDAILALPSEPDLKSQPLSIPPNTPPEIALHDALIGPIESKLDGVKHLTLIANGLLESVPLDLIGRGKRLTERFELSFAPSLSLLALMRDSRRPEREKSSRVLLFDAREGTTPEIRSRVGSIRESGLKVEALLGPAARLDRLLGVATEGYEAIHFRGDARIIAEAPLRASILVLEPSASGLESLAQPVTWALETGAATVLVPLWRPPTDSSSLFQTELHRGLKEGKTPVECLDAARRLVASDPRFRDPVHWAGYRLYGP